MADEEIEVEGKKKSPLIKIVVIALVAILLLAGTAVGTMSRASSTKKTPTQRSRL